jgi:hypothetical protein
MNLPAGTEMNYAVAHLLETVKDPASRRTYLSAAANFLHTWRQGDQSLVHLLYNEAGKPTMIINFAVPANAPSHMLQLQGEVPQ